MITREQLADMRLAAEMCDDYSQWKREMAVVRQLEGKLGAPTPKATPARPIQKRLAPGIHCKTIAEALAVLEQRLVHA